MTNSLITGVGRRKTASVQVRLVSGKGELTINGQESPLPSRLVTLLESVDKLRALDISVVARGGGKTGQLEAMILGVARALVELNPDLKSALRKSGYLTRDARIKERKKPGLKKARRAPQWAKR